MLCGLWVAEGHLPFEIAADIVRYTVSIQREYVCVRVDASARVSKIAQVVPLLPRLAIRVNRLIKPEQSRSLVTTEHWHVVNLAELAVVALIPVAAARRPSVRLPEEGRSRLAARLVVALYLPAR